MHNQGGCTHIWSQTNSQTAAENALRHWRDHRHDFPNLNNAKEYVDFVSDWFRNPPATTLTKTRVNGDIVMYDPATDLFGVWNHAQQCPRTCYKPTPGVGHSYLTNLDYFNAQ